MKHKKTIGGLMILVSLALAGCDFGRLGSSSDVSTSDIISSEVTTSVVSSNEETSIASESMSEGSSEVEEVDGFALRTAADLELLREHSDGVFHLMNDIDISEVDWVPIEVFSGTIHGQNNKIIGLSVDGIYPLAGFFAMIEGAMIYDLTFFNAWITVFTDPDIESQVENAAGVVAGLQVDSPGSGRITLLENVHVEGLVVINMIDDGTKPEDALDIVGGLIGVSEGNITIFNSSAVLAGGGGLVVGGLIGYASGSGVMTISESNASNDVIGKMIAGGLIGASENRNILIASSSSTADVTNFGEVAAGGIIGAVIGGSVSIHNSYNTGTITISVNSSEPIGTGGIVGLAVEGAILSLISVGNSGEVRARLATHAGGLVGLSAGSRSLYISKSFNDGKITAGMIVGGLIAGLYETDEAIITNSYNVGEVVGASLIGGFAGNINDTDLEIHTSYNNRSITSSINNVGGFIGSANESIVIVKDSLHIGDITAEYTAGTFAGYTAHGLQVTNSFYNTEFSDGDGGETINPSLQGSAVTLAEINSDFFITNLGWNAEIWNLTAIDSGNLPTLK